MNASGAPRYRLFEMRSLTAILLIVVCLPVLWRGFQLTRFSLIERSMLSDADTFRPFFDVPGLKYSARQDAYSGDLKGNDEDGAEKRAEELTSILSVAHLSSSYWLILAGMRQVAREPKEMVSDALAMSRLTGTHEGYVLAQRAIFALAMWEGLNDEARNGAVRDLTAAWQGLQTAKKQQIGAILTDKSAATRETVTRRLFQTGKLSTEDLAGIGLKSDEFRK
jgi:hypothetical protein